MQLGLNGATTMGSTLEEDLAAAESAGFDFLEIRAPKLEAFLERHDVDDLKALFEGKKCQPYSINSIENITFREEEDYEGLRDLSRHYAEIGAAIGCRYIVVTPSPLPSAYTEEEIIKETSRALWDLMALTMPHDVRLALEFIGFRDCSVSTLDLAWKIVRKVSMPHVGLVLDTFHFYVGDTEIDHIDAVAPEKIFIVQASDAEDLPRSELGPDHRLFPGDGIIPLAGILGRLGQIGYDRVVSVKVPRPDFSGRAPAELAAEAKAGAVRVLSEGGV